MTKKDKIKHEQWVQSYRETAKKHFLKRFYERMSFDLPLEAFNNITRILKGFNPEGCSLKIHDKKSSFMRKVHVKRRWILVTYIDSLVSFTAWILWDRDNKLLITILDENTEPSSEPIHLGDVITNEFYAQFEGDSY